MTDQNQDPQIHEEPSVLDYFLAKLRPWRGPAPEIPPLPEEDQQSSFRARVFSVDEEEETEFDEPIAIPWCVFGALLLALIAQFVLMPPLKQGLLGAALFLAAFGMSLWAVLEHKVDLTAPADHPQEEEDRFEFPMYTLLAGMAFSLVAFWAFHGNRYNQFNLLLWLVGLGLIIWTFLSPRPEFSEWVKKAFNFIKHDIWQVKITRNMVLFVLVLAVGIFFKASKVGQVVPEMFSDQAEKLLDVYDVLQGQTRIFFPRNTGREGFQFYLIAATINLFHTGISFLSMKIGTIFMGIFMLPYIYLLGKELGNKTVGLTAMFFTGVSFWLNVLSRVALRFILYPAFAAPVLYYLIRGLRTGKRNYFIASAVFLGIGLHGYTPFRAVPILVVVVFFLYWLHNRRSSEQSVDNQQKKVFYKTIIWLSVVVLISLIIFLPLLRVWFEMPEIFNYRTITRLVGEQRGEDVAHGFALVGVFIKNVWDGLLMFNWDSGNIWVNTITNHPSLDMVTGAFFVLGVGLVLVRYFRQRRWEDLFLLVAIPILMLPSTLVLAYPEENPAPNRAGGAAVVVFVIAAIAFDALLRAIRDGVEGKVGQRMALAFGVVLLLFAAGHNYSMTFNTFATQYKQGAWNTSELGAVIEQFTDTVGSPDHAWVVAYPYWVDTRLVGINAGFPIKDFAIAPEDLTTTESLPSPKLFLVKPDDTASLDLLEYIYPEGKASLYQSSVPSHNFYIFYVP